MTIDWVAKALIVLILFKPITSWANDIYINQAGDNINMTIVQDGENNVISSVAGNTRKAPISGNNTSTTFTQTGDNNDIGVYMSAGNGQQTITQTGNTNYATSDCHGNNCSTTITQYGNNNLANLEFGKLSSIFLHMNNMNRFFHINYISEFFVTT